MDTLSEEYIRNHCPHCDASSHAYAHPLKESANFRVVHDAHGIVEGHILIIPKEHIIAIGEYSESLFREFLSLYEEVQRFIKRTYGNVASFEHGGIGQSVFHSHVHLLPFSGNVTDIVPEGEGHVKKINGIFDLKDIYAKEQKYLFFSLEEQTYVVDTALGSPRFFRDRFANALGKPERGDWKEMDKNEDMMIAVKEEAMKLKGKWIAYYKITNV